MLQLKITFLVDFLVLLLAQMWSYIFYSIKLLFRKIILDTKSSYLRAFKPLSNDYLKSFG